MVVAGILHTLLTEIIWRLKSFGLVSLIVYYYFIHCYLTPIALAIISSLLCGTMYGASWWFPWSIMAVPVISTSRLFLSWTTTLSFPSRILQGAMGNLNVGREEATCYENTSRVCGGPEYKGCIWAACYTNKGADKGIVVCCGFWKLIVLNSMDFWPCVGILFLATYWCNKNFLWTVN